jgi:hypothetical protein
MTERIEERLTQLRAEFENGQRVLDDLEARRAGVQSSLLRIAGAIQVLEELIAGQPDEGEPPTRLKTA